MTFAEKMIHLRKINGYTQSQFAEKVGVSRQTVYKWESGQVYPDLKKAAIILKMYSLTLDQLINDEISIDGEGYAVRTEAPVAPEQAPAKKRGIFAFWKK